MTKLKWAEKGGGGQYWGGWWGRRKWGQVLHKGKVLKKLGPCNLDGEELRVEMETWGWGEDGWQVTMWKWHWIYPGWKLQGESLVCINQGLNSPSSAFQTMTPLSLGTSRTGSVAPVKGVRWQVGGGLGFRAQPGVLWSRHSPKHVPTGQCFFTDTISWAAPAQCSLHSQSWQASVWGHSLVPGSTA